VIRADIKTLYMALNFTLFSLVFCFRFAKELKEKIMKEFSIT
jgi:hypothetical protein